MSRTDHSRRARRPEHADGAPRRQPRPAPRRQATRRAASLAAWRSLA